jgi:hypothetical protein
MFKEIQLSETQANVFSEFVGAEKNGKGMAWVRNVINHAELSEEEKEFSSVVEDIITRIDRFNNRQAKDELSQIAVIMIENDYVGYPVEIVNQCFNRASFGEFDTAIQRGRIKNTLKVYETAPRTGNVDADYVDFSEGSVQRTHMQAEIIYKIEDLRKAGAVGFAEFVNMIREQLEIAKFKALFNMLLNLKPAPDAQGSITASLVDDMAVAVKSNCKEGMPTFIGLMTKVDALAKAYASNCPYISEGAKAEMVSTGTLRTMDGINFSSVRDALKNADGETLIPANVLIGVAGKIGTFYEGGTLRTYVIEDGNSEDIHYKITGVEMGLIVDMEDVKDKLFIAKIS